MIDDTTLYLLVGLILGFFVGFRVNEHIHRTIISDIFKRAGVTPEKLQEMMLEMQKEIGIEPDEADMPRVEIKIEQHNGQLYAFRKDNDQFLGQGSDRDSLLKTIAEKFNNVTLVIAEADGAGHIKENPTS